MEHQDSEKDAYYSRSESKTDTSTFIETDAQINEAIKSSFLSDHHLTLAKEVEERGGREQFTIAFKLKLKLLN